MSASRRTPWLFLLALPLWLAMAVPAATQTLTADINGDGISDRIEAGGPDGGVLVQLSEPGPAQRLRAAGPILDLAVADIDQDGDADLVATTAGRRHIRLLIWINAGGGRLVSRLPGRARSGTLRAWERLRIPGDIPALDDLSDAPGSVVALPSRHGGRDAIAGEPLPAADDCLPTRPHTRRRAPRGPPAIRLLS